MENKIIISDETLKNSKEIVKSMDLKQSCETFFKLDFLTKNIKDELTNNIVKFTKPGDCPSIVYGGKIIYLTPVVSKDKVETVSEASLNIDKVTFYANKNNLEIPMKIDIDKLVQLDWFKKNRNEFYDWTMIEKVTKAKKPYIKITGVKK